MTMKKQGAFTLVELLMVIAIIGLLSSIVLVATKNVIEKAKIGRSLRFSSGVHQAVGAYLVGEWKFEEGVPNTCQNPQNPNFNSDCDSYYDDFCDSSGNRNHGCLKGANPWVESDIPQLGKAGRFPGGENFAKIPDSPNLDGMSELTIQFWFKSLVAPPIGGFDPVYKLCSYGFQIYNPNLNVTSVRFFVWKEDVVVCGPGWDDVVLNEISPFKIGQWYHVAASYYGGGGTINPRMKLYLNGHLIASKTLSWLPGTYLRNTDNEIGLGYSPYSTDFMIDEVRIYQGELTSAQIEKLYAQGAEKHGLLTEK